MPVWVGLTLLMLMLVLLSAFIFLYQSLSEQQIASVGLQNTISTLESERAAVDDAQMGLRVQLTQQAGPLADYAATQTAVVPTVAVPADATVDVAVTEEATITPTLALSETVVVTNTVTPTPTVVVSETEPMPTPAVPEISLSAPADGLILNPGNVISVTADITDTRGLEQVWLLVNDEVVKTLAAANKIEFKYQPEWVAPATGRFELAVGAKNLEGREHSTQGIVIFVEQTSETNTETTSENGE